MDWDTISSTIASTMLAFLFLGFILSASYMAMTSINHTLNYGDQYDQLCRENFGESWEYDGVATYPFEDKIGINCLKDTGEFSPPREQIKLSKTEWEQTVAST